MIFSRKILIAIECRDESIFCDIYKWHKSHTEVFHISLSNIMSEMINNANSQLININIVSDKQISARWLVTQIMCRLTFQTISWTTVEGGLTEGTKGRKMCALVVLFNYFTMNIDPSDSTYFFLCFLVFSWKLHLSGGRFSGRFRISFLGVSLVRNNGLVYFQILTLNVSERRPDVI